METFEIDRLPARAKSQISVLVHIDQGIRAS